MKLQRDLGQKLDQAVIKKWRSVLDGMRSRSAVFMPKMCIQVSPV